MRKGFFNSIYTKFTLIFFGVLLFAAMLTFGAIYMTQYGKILEQIKLELINQAEAVQTLSQNNLSNDEITGLFHQGHCCFSDCSISWGNRCCFYPG